MKTTVLGPLLFSIHIAGIDYLLAESIESSFADDTRITMQTTSDTDVLNFQKELDNDKVFMWAQSNKMTFKVQSLNTCVITQKRM